MTSTFQLWRDGLILTAVIVGGGLLLLSSVGFNGTWELESLDGVAAPAGRLEARFREPRRGRPDVAAITPCRRYDGAFDRFAGRITLYDLEPAAFCPGDKDLIEILARADHYRLRNERLTLTTTAGETLVFTHGPGLVDDLRDLARPRR